jgi:hypothetical protein
MLLPMVSVNDSKTLVVPWSRLMLEGPRLFTISKKEPMKHLISLQQIDLQRFLSGLYVINSLSADK